MLTLLAVCISPFLGQLQEELSTHRILPLFLDTAVLLCGVAQHITRYWLHGCRLAGCHPPDTNYFPQFYRDRHVPLCTRCLHSVLHGQVPAKGTANQKLCQFRLCLSPCTCPAQLALPCTIFSAAHLVGSTGGFPKSAGPTGCLT